jgi:hypothetical protein
MESATGSTSSPGLKSGALRATCCWRSRYATHTHPTIRFARMQAYGDPYHIKASQLKGMLMVGPLHGSQDELFSYLDGYREKKRTLLTSWRWRSGSQYCTPGVAGFYPPDDDTPNDSIPCTLSESTLKPLAPLSKLTVDLTVKPLKPGEIVGISEKNKIKAMRLKRLGRRVEHVEANT